MIKAFLWIFGIVAFISALFLSGELKFGIYLIHPWYIWIVFLASATLAITAYVAKVEEDRILK